MILITLLIIMMMILRNIIDLPGEAFHQDCDNFYYFVDYDEDDFEKYYY